MPRKEHLPPEPRCWLYKTDGGWLIYAGKTDEDNDLLSLSFARQYEHWFHVASLPGSHVILRPPEGCEDEEPTKALLETAAAVAAWHSKARNAGTVPVSTTLARFVGKPRGAKPGLVSISHETTIKVKPALPPQI